MNRFTMTVSLFLLGSLPSSAPSIGQEPARVEPPSQDRAETVKETRAGDKPATATLSEEVYRTLVEHSSQALNRFPDPLETNFGLSLADADDTLRSQLEIPGSEGVVVVGVKESSLAEQAGLKLNDVFLKLGDQPARAADQVRQILLGLGKEALEVRLIREGKPRRLSLVGPEHGFPPEAAEFWIGVPVSPVDPTLRSHLPTLLANSGLIANDVVKGSPADRAGVKKDDVLVTMNGQPLWNSDALIAQIQASKGKTVPLELLRAGKPLNLTITPAKRAHPTVINVRANPEVQSVFQVVRPNLAIEVDPSTYGPQPFQRPGLVNSIESKSPASSRITLFAPYSGVMIDPYAGPSFEYSSNNSRPIYPVTSYPQVSVAESSTARIEGQLKEVLSKLEEMSKSLDALKKQAGR